VEIPLEEVFKKLFILKNKNPLDSEVMEIMKYFRNESTKYIKLYDGVLYVLDELKKKGKKIYLLSNAQYYFTMPEIEELGIKDYFDGIVISSCEGYKKPNSKFYEALFSRYNLSKKESVMIGNDSLCDIEGAKLFGLDTFYINTNISPEYDKNKNVISTYKSINGSVRDYLEIVK
jgi:putative hydrolase of the HAD superfamily